MEYEIEKIEFKCNIGQTEYIIRNVIKVFLFKLHAN